MKLRPVFATLASLGLVLTALSGFSTAAQDGGTGGESTPGRAIHLQVRGAIGPATSSYIVKGLEQAAATGARVLILEMDTPGGLDSAMRDIIKAILASPLPVLTYVSPSGSRAASAGTYILYASHVAAMAPATNLGAATPVQIGGGSPGPQPGSQPESTPVEGEKKEGKTEAREQPGSATERKAVNDAVAYIRGLATLRDRNGDWAELAVRSAASLSAEEALRENVIDLIASDVADLLGQAHGRKVKLGEATVSLDTEKLTVERLEPDWRTKFLETITDPNVAYLLMLVGIYGLIFEGYNPGAIVPGVVGAICLLLALFAFQVLSVNYAGLALIGLGIVLIIAEAFVPSFGALGLGGIVAFVFGSIILLDDSMPGVVISTSLIGGIALAASAALLTMVIMLMRIRRRPVVSGMEGIVGEEGEALEDFTGRGTVFVHGERWNAHCVTPLRRGDRVRVRQIHGLILEVDPLPAGASPGQGSPAAR